MILSIRIYLFFILTIGFHAISFSQELILERLNDQINSKYDEITPVVSRDGQTLYFTRVGSPDYDRTLMEDEDNLFELFERKEYHEYLQEIYSMIAQQRIVNPVSSRFNQDVWIAKAEQDSFVSVEHPTYPLNNALPNSICSVTPFDNTFVIINQFPKDGGMNKGYSIIQQVNDSTWTFPEPITIEDYYNLQEKVNMTMSTDGSVIIFSMIRENAYGQSDLYASFRKEGNTWGPPINLGPLVNTHHRETTPFLSDDNKTLYFASDRRTAFGQRDIYLVFRLDDTWQKWSAPARYKKPVNSIWDDSQPYFNSATGYLYFSSNRDQSKDIYRVRVAPPIPFTVTVKGRILNAKTNKRMAAKVISGPATQSNVRNVYLSEDGTFKLTVSKGQQIKLLPEKTGYIGRVDTVFFKKSYVYYKEYEVTLYLDPVEVGMKVELPPIYFKQSTPIILEKSFPTLDELADFMKENGSVKIKIEGHTDNQGDKASLKQLSEQRAEAIKEYLMGRGIETNRLQTVGLGDTRPVNDNSTEELRKQNRRVEFVVIEK